MKVKCIAAGINNWVDSNHPILKRFLGFTVSKKKRRVSGPKEGDVCTVTSEFWSQGEKYYRLLEWPAYNNGGYNSKEFIPLEENYESVSFKEVIKEKAPSLN